jgi:acyl dehydratase
MTIDASTVGTTTAPYAHSYSWRDQAVYALGIGAKRDELDHLYENVGGGMKVYPTYAVVPAFEPVVELIGAAKADMAMIVHGGQTIVAHRPLPPSAKLETTGTLKAIYDLKRFAQLIIETRSTIDGEPACDSEWSIIVRDAGGFGGERPPRDKSAPKIAKDSEPDWTVEQATSEEQALLYRVSGDVNPLHADPAFAKKVGFEQGPILHGLCTYGFVARAIIQSEAGGDAVKLKRFAAQFRKPVWPGDTIVTRGYRQDDGRVAVQATVKGRPDPVVTNAGAELDS